MEMTAATMTADIVFALTADFLARALVLRCALKARGCLARFALGSFTNPERTRCKLALYAGLPAVGDRGLGERARVTRDCRNKSPEQSHRADHRS